MKIKIYDDMSSCTEWQSGVVRTNLPAHRVAKIVFDEVLTIMRGWDGKQIDDYLVSMLRDFGTYESEDWSCDQCGHVPESYLWEIEVPTSDKPVPSEQNPPQKEV